MHHKYKHVRTFALGSLCALICLLIAISYHPSRVSASFKPPSDARILNVRNFGATPNDNTDDAKAIQKAIAQAIDTKSFGLEEGTDPFVILEYLYLQGGGISHSSKRALVIRHCDFPSYTNTPTGTGDLFVEDVIGKLLILNPQNVWARQLNTELQNPVSILEVLGY